MTDYNQYVTAVNKIFDCLAKMKTGWDSLDNFNYIESIEEYKQDVINSTEVFKKKPPVSDEQKSLEELGDDW